MNRTTYLLYLLATLYINLVNYFRQQTDGASTKIKKIESIKTLNGYNKKPDQIALIL